MLNDWQLSGIFRADSGTPYDVGFSYGSGGGVLLTGSPDYNARVVLTGDPGNGCSSNQYQQFNTAAFSGPMPGSVGLESGRNYLSGCNNRTLDLAIARTIRLGGSPLAADPRGRLQRAERGDVERPIDDGQLHEPDQPDGDQSAVPRGWLDRSDAAHAEPRRLRGRQRRARSAHGAIADSLLVLGRRGHGEELEGTEKIGEHGVDGGRGVLGFRKANELRGLRFSQCPPCLRPVFRRHLMRMRIATTSMLAAACTALLVGGAVGFAQQTPPPAGAAAPAQAPGGRGGGQDACGGRSSEPQVPCAADVTRMMATMTLVPDKPPATPARPRKVLVLGRAADSSTRRFRSPRG